MPCRTGSGARLSRSPWKTWTAPDLSDVERPRLAEGLAVERGRRPAVEGRHHGPFVIKIFFHRTGRGFPPLAIVNRFCRWPVGRDQCAAAGRLGMDQFEPGERGVVGEQPLAAAAGHDRADHQGELIEQPLLDHGPLKAYVSDASEKRVQVRGS